MFVKEINIAKVIAHKRKEKEITQNALANYLGVSKASVSKWETGQSYPDITLIPHIATYFNITIDELMGYEPQLSKEEIRHLYHQLAADFANKPFDDVMEHCHEIIKKYYSCFPLLLQMALLFFNHHMLSPHKEQPKEILEEAISLCRRIQSESCDTLLSKEALEFEVVGFQMMGNPKQVLEILGEDVSPMSQTTENMATAYQQLGNIDKAMELTQIAMYQHLLSLIGNATQLITLHTESLERVNMIADRVITIINTFKVDHLNPNSSVQTYFCFAQTYCLLGQTDKAIDMLERYCNVCTNELFPLTLHGDSFFDRIDGWFKDFDLGNIAPRNEKVVKQNIIDSVKDNPAFAVLAEELRFQEIVKKLKNNC